MKLLHTADVHLGLTSLGDVHEEGMSDRIRDFGATFNRFADAAIEQKVDLVIIAGDLYENRRPGPEEILLAARPVHRMTDAGIPVLVGTGNHDGMGTIASPETHTLAWMEELAIPGVRIFTKPYVGPVVDLRGEPIAIVVSVPYPHKRAYDAALAEQPMPSRVEAVSRDVQSIISQLGDEAADWPGNLPRLFIGHLSVAGSRLGSETLMHMGWDVVIAPEAMARFDYAALGHIHLQQQIGANAWYAGSPDYINLGEAEDPKSFLLVEVEHGKPAVVTRIPSNPRPIVKLVLQSWEPGTETEIPLPASMERLHGAIVHLVIDVGRPVPDRAIAGLKGRLRELGASFVKDRVILPEAEARARVELDAGGTIEHALEAWCRAHGVDPDKVLPVGRELAASFQAG